jgi:hypothetical protein
MLTNPFFALWVAHTVHTLSGIWPDFIDEYGECALTCVEPRMDACQVGFNAFLHPLFVDSMRVADEVPTNKRVLH